MSKLTMLLFVLACALVQGKGIFSKLKDHINEKAHVIHDKIHDIHDKHHDKHHNHQPNQPTPPPQPVEPSPFPYEPEYWNGPKMKMRPAILYFNLDDRITEFYINQNRIPLQFSDKDADSWAKTKKMQMYLYPGDIIKIVGKDIYGPPFGLVGSIHVFNKKNHEKIYNTGKGWFCNGKEAGLKGYNDGSSKNWEYMPLIEKDAQWIWDQKATSKDEVVTCVFEIPC